MKSTVYEQVKSNLEYLKLHEMVRKLDETIDFVNKNELGFVEGLRILTSYEKDLKQSNMMNAMVKTAGFPRIKRLNDYDFSYQPDLNRAEIMDFSNLRFIENTENIVFLGNSGVGKTHLATAIGYEAAINRNSTYFIKFQELIAQLKRALIENRLEPKLKKLGMYKLLIIDEIGYLPITREEAQLFFQVIDKRYERHSTIITTNMNFNRWEEIFIDPIIANAIMDRILHHAKIIRIKGKSYRIKDLLFEGKENGKQQD